MNQHILEPEAQEIADATSTPPFLYELGPEGARKVLDDLQAASSPSSRSTRSGSRCPPRSATSRSASSSRPVRPECCRRSCTCTAAAGCSATPALTTGSCELAVGAGAAVVFAEYDRSPEAHYPVAIEQAYATARWITRRLAEVSTARAWRWPAIRSAGTWLPRWRCWPSSGDVTFVHQSLYYPVTDAAQDTDSYREFAGGPSSGPGLVLGRLPARCATSEPR